MPTFINKYIIFIKCVTTSVLIYLTIILCEVCNNLQTHNNRVLMRLTLKHSNKNNMKLKVNSGHLNHHPLKKVIKFCSLSFYPHHAGHQHLQVLLRIPPQPNLKICFHSKFPNFTVAAELARDGPHHCLALFDISI